MNALRPADARHEVENLLGQYAEAADGRDVGAVAELLADAAVHFAGRELVGGDAIRQHYAPLFEAAPISRHLISNVIIDQEDDEIRFRCRYSRWQIDPTAELLAIGDYVGTCLNRQSGVYIASFTVTRTWQVS